MKKINTIIKRCFQVLALTATVLPLSAQTVRINVDEASFTRPLIEKLVSEYKKKEPAFEVQFVSDGTACDASISISNPTGDAIARYFILPVTNVEAEILKEKKVQKGVNQKLVKEIFVECTLDEQLDDIDKKQLQGTVYALSGKHSQSTSLLAKSLNVDEKDIKGKKILGREENVLAIVKKRPDAISVNAASLIYDQTTRRPVAGVAVLPVDLDGNNKVSDEEREAIANIDLLTAYLAHSNNALPAADITILSDNHNVKAFVSWASTNGQKFLGALGYLKAERQLAAQK